MKRLLVLVVLVASVAPLSAEPRFVTIFASSWFQARDQAFSNIVVIPIRASANTVEEALRLPGAEKLTIRGDAFLSKGEAYSGTVDDEKGQLIVDGTNSRGKATTKKFKVFDAGWTSPTQLR